MMRRGKVLLGKFLFIMVISRALSIINSPVNIVKEYQEEGNARVQYKANKQTTTIGSGNEKDAKRKTSSE